MIDILVKILNIYVIYWIFKQNFSERRDERKRDVKRESLKFMIQELILKPNMDDVKIFFSHETWKTKEIDNAKAQVPQVADLASAGAQDIKLFKEAMDKLRQRVIFPLRRLSPNGFIMLPQIVRDAEDSYTEHVENLCVNQDEQALPPKIESLREAFIDALLAGQLKIFEDAEPSGEVEPSFIQKLLD